MKKILIFQFLLLSVQVFAQKQQINCASNLQASQTIKNMGYIRYPDSLVVTKYSAFEEVTNTTPEELMRSILSASSLEWKNFNTQKQITTSSQDFESIRNALDSNYYFVLESKIDFTASGNQYAVVKFRLFENGKIYGFAEGMVKKNNRWYTTEDAEINQLLFFMGMVDLDYIEAIFRQNETNNVQFDQIREQYLELGSINLTGLLSTLEQSLSENKLLEILDPNRIFK